MKGGTELGNTACLFVPDGAGDPYAGVFGAFASRPGKFRV